MRKGQSSTSKRVWRKRERERERERDRAREGEGEVKAKERETLIGGFAVDNC
jgi:hypothetical protein